MGLTKQQRLIDQMNQQRWGIMEEARSSGTYAHYFAPMRHTTCPCCGKDYAPAAPMIREEDWQRICGKLNITGQGLVCLACAEKGNGGHIALDQIEQVPFNVYYFLTELALPMLGTERELEALTYFGGYISKRIKRGRP